MCTERDEAIYMVQRAAGTNDIGQVRRSQSCLCLSQLLYDWRTLTVFDRLATERELEAEQRRVDDEQVDEERREDERQNEIQQQVWGAAHQVKLRVGGSS